MKKRLLCVLSVVLCLCMLCGCSSSSGGGDVAGGQSAPAKPTESPEETPAPTTTKVDTLPGSFPMEFYFSSGAGAWGTSLTLKSDGSFEGEFHDTNLGETGEGYENGTVYICSFKGKFGDVQKINDSTYKMTLADINTDEAVGSERIEDSVLYISSEPYGLDTGKDFVFYTPDAKTATLSEDFLSWWPYRFDDSQPDTLSCYGIYNLDGGQGFFTY